MVAFWKARACCQASAVLPTPSSAVLPTPSKRGAANPKQRGAANPKQRGAAHPKPEPWFMSLVSLLERAGLPAHQFACPQPELPGHMLCIAPGALACPGTLAMRIGHPANAWVCTLTISAMHGCSIAKRKNRDCTGRACACLCRGGQGDLRI